MQSDHKNLKRSEQNIAQRVVTKHRDSAIDHDIEIEMLRLEQQKELERQQKLSQEIELIKYKQHSNIINSSKGQEFISTLMTPA